MEAFKELGVCDELAEAAAALGWKGPTEIQKQAIPQTLAGTPPEGLFVPPAVPRRLGGSCSASAPPLTWLLHRRLTFGAWICFTHLRKGRHRPSADGLGKNRRLCNSDSAGARVFWIKDNAVRTHACFKHNDSTRRTLAASAAVQMGGRTEALVSTPRVSRRFSTSRSPSSPSFFRRHANWRSRSRSRCLQREELSLCTEQPCEAASEALRLAAHGFTRAPGQAEIVASRKRRQSRAPRVFSLP